MQKPGLSAGQWSALRKRYLFRRGGLGNQSWQLQSVSITTVTLIKRRHTFVPNPLDLHQELIPRCQTYCTLRSRLYLLCTAVSTRLRSGVGLWYRRVLMLLTRTPSYLLSNIPPIPPFPPSLSPL